MTTLIKYAVPCVTEGTIVISGYRSSIPTNCPNSTEHTINSAGIQALDSTLTKQILVAQNSPTVLVGGYFSCEQINMDITPNDTVNYDVSFPYNINAYTVVTIGIILHITIE